MDGVWLTFGDEPDSIEIPTPGEYHETATGDRVDCPECNRSVFTVYWQDPGPSLAGGTLILCCVACKHEWVYYDDEA